MPVNENGCVLSAALATFPPKVIFRTCESGASVSMVITIARNAVTRLTQWGFFHMSRFR
jgi:hypothetical protein